MIEIQVEDHRLLVDIVTYLELNWSSLDVTVTTSMPGTYRYMFTIRIRSNK